jgi:hypothetical protein
MIFFGRRGERAGGIVVVAHAQAEDKEKADGALR